jgi:hypothetical protein
LGGLSSDDIFRKKTSALDPIRYPIEDDQRLLTSKKKNNNNKKKKPYKTKIGADHQEKSSLCGEGKNMEEVDGCNDNIIHYRDHRDNDFEQQGTTAGGGEEEEEQKPDQMMMEECRRIWPYEPLPRTGLEHPFVKAILDSWFGSEMEEPGEVDQGLYTLRNWWQHRRGGESRSAINALGTEKMQEVVNEWTRYFFELAHKLIKKDGELPPKTLLSSMKIRGEKRQTNHQKLPKKAKPPREHKEKDNFKGESYIATTCSVSTADKTVPTLPTSSTVGSAVATAADMAAPATASAGPASTGGLEGILANLGTPPAFTDSSPSSSHEASVIQSLLQLRQSASILPPDCPISLNVAQILRQTDLLATNSALTPLERLHLIQRQQRLDLINSMLSGSSLQNISQAGSLRHVYNPPSWLLLDRSMLQGQLPVDE